MKQNNGSIYSDYFGGIVCTPRLPSKLLQPLIKRYTFCDTSSVRTHDKAELTSLPNATVELFIHFGDTRVLLKSPITRGIYQDVLIGMFSFDNPLQAVPPSYPSRQEVAIVSFTHLGVHRLIGASPRSLQGKLLTMEDIWGREGKRLLDFLDNAENNDKRKEALDRFFLHRLQNTPAAEDGLYMKIFTYLERNHRKITIEHISRDLGIPYSSLYRIFDRQVGMSPKEFLRIRRFNHACTILASNPAASWHDIVFACGYYDQAHFIHEFTSLMKASPRQFLEASNGSFMITHPFRIEAD